MDIKEIHQLLKNRTAFMQVRINPKLLALFTETIETDTDYNSRTDFIEAAVLKYLEEKGKL